MTRTKRPHHAGRFTHWHLARRTFAIVVVVASAGCQADSATSARVEIRSVSLAKGGGTSGTLAVTSTAPTSAKQDTTVDVNVYGSGFSNGAAATWSLAGDTTQVHVSSTKYVSSTQLVARVVVPAGAPIASYDVVVMLIGGKKGVGAELFAVTQGDAAATFLFPLDATGVNVTGDGAFTDGVNTVYTDGVCGVWAPFFVSGSGDATYSTNSPKSKDLRCASWPRRIRLTFPDGFSEMTYTGTNLRQIEKATFIIPIGATVKRALHMGTGESTRCTGIVWSSDEYGTPLGGDSVLVTRTAEDTWHVQSQPFPNNRVHCKPSGTVYNMAIDFTVRSSRPLP
jgi:hypothetical protein